MIYKINTNNKKLLRATVEVLKQSDGFMYRDGVVYLNSQEELKIIIRKIEKIRGKQSALFFVEEITDKMIVRLPESIKVWIKEIKAKEEFDKTLKENLAIYDNFLDYLENGLQNGMFIKHSEGSADAKT